MMPVDEMEVLGTAFDSHGSTSTSLEHRLQKAEACFWKHLQTFSGPGTISNKLKAWQAGPGSSAVFGAGTWHVTKNIVVQLQRWEMKFLRKTFKMRWRPEEGRMRFNKRTSTIIREWFRECQRQPLHIRVLSAVFKEAWREKGEPIQQGENDLAILRNYRNREWWHWVKDLQQERAKEGLLHLGKGFRYEWEDVFCTAFGVFWRHRRDLCESLSQWMGLFPEFLESLNLQWNLQYQGPSAATQPSRIEDLEVGRRKGNHYCLSDLPDQHGLDCPPVLWDSNKGCICFIVDCKPLAQGINGQAPLLQLI